MAAGGGAAEQELTHDGRREVAVRLLDEQAVPVLAGVAQIGEIVLAQRPARERRRVVVQRARLADEVEPDIGERDVLLQRRGVAAPFGQPVPEHQRVVRPAEREAHEGGLVEADGGGGHLIPLALAHIVMLRRPLLGRLDAPRPLDLCASFETRLRRSSG